MAKAPDSQKSAQPGKTSSEMDVNKDLDARPEDVDKVKGGGIKRIVDDPCAGGHLSHK
jgi:hypothetical protein